MSDATSIWSKAIWSKENCPFELASNQIDIWYIDLGEPKFENIDSLNIEEKNRADKFLHVVNRQQFIRARASLRLILGRYLQMQASDLSFSYGEKGKPDLDPSNPIKFNLSHSADTAILAVAKDRNLGIDISHTNRQTNWQGIAKRSFTESENKTIETTENKQAQFHHLWSLKEAYTKALGLGFSYGFQKFSIDPSSGHISDSLKPRAAEDWSIVTFNPDPITIAAVAFDGPSDANINYWALV